MNTDPSSSFVTDRTIVLTGMMGAGKSSVGRRLATRLGLTFADSDHEIEAAAGMTVARFFESYGEAEFRKGERRVIARLLEAPPHILATGGGAFLEADTRALIRDKAYSVWITAPLDILFERAMRRDDRPLLHGDNPRAIMEKLLAERAPLYAQADITIESDLKPVDDTVERVVQALARLPKVTRS